MNKFYITTTLPYVNAEPHIGFALEIIQADVIARFKRLMGFDVFFNFGTDEHGLKIYRKAIEEKKNPKAYCDEYAAKFDLLKKWLNLSYNNFIRTTDEHHIKASQEFWRSCLKNGDIYKKNYKVKYCVGCELEKTDSELENDHCILHPTQEMEIYEEENYFFRFSKYQTKLLELYEKNKSFVIPAQKLKEIENFVRSGLSDFSVSRLKAKMPWGIEVPDDVDHVMYVWFDALINYVSAIGWPEDKEKFNEWWPVYQVAGKDNLRQQSAIWQSMLMSVGLPASKQIFIHGFLTLNGQKISKSTGNTIDPIEMANKYGTDGLRYYLLSKVHPWEDSDFSISKFTETYNADLANGLGNLVARIAKLAEKISYKARDNKQDFYPEIIKELDEYRFDHALEFLWQKIKELDLLIEQTQPWKLEDKTLSEFIGNVVPKIQKIAFNLLPFIPETSEKITQQYSGEVKSQNPLFPRIK